MSQFKFCHTPLHYTNICFGWFVQTLVLLWFSPTLTWKVYKRKHLPIEIHWGQGKSQRKKRKGWTLDNFRTPYEKAKGERSLDIYTSVYRYKMLAVGSRFRASCRRTQRQNLKHWHPDHWKEGAFQMRPKSSPSSGITLFQHTVNSKIFELKWQPPCCPSILELHGINNWSPPAF